jgi:hypothetical protein
MRKRILRILAWLLGGACMTVVLLAGVILLDQYLLRRRAEHLLSDIRSLELRKSTYLDARGVIDRWWDEAHQQGPCRADWCDVEISLTDFAWSHAEFLFRTPTRSRIFRWLGARPAIVGASIRVRNDVVLGKAIEEYVGGPCHDFNDQTTCLTVMGHVQTGKRRFIDRRHPEYSFYEPSGCEICVDARVIFSPYANTADVQRLTDVNFGCITQWTPCENEDDILPMAWAQVHSERALPPDVGGSCSGTVRTLSRELGSVPLATVTLVGNIEEGPQITVRWDEQREMTKHEYQGNTFPQRNSTRIHKGDRVLVFEGRMFSSFDSCAIVPATEENLLSAREGVSENLSGRAKALNLPFGSINPPRVNVR